MRMGDEENRKSGRDKAVKPLELSVIPESENEPEFTCTWAIIVMCHNGNAYIAAADGGFTAYDMLEAGDELDGSPIDYPSEWVENPPPPSVWRVTGLTCVDNGVCHGYDYTEYDTPTFGKGKWEQIFDIDAAIPDGEPS